MGLALRREMYYNQIWPFEKAQNKECQYGQIGAWNALLTYSFEGIGSVSMYEYLYRCIREDILKGRLRPGERLPSKRPFAANLGVSTITV